MKHDQHARWAMDAETETELDSWTRPRAASMGLLEAVRKHELLPDLFSCNGILKAFGSPFLDTKRPRFSRKIMIGLVNSGLYW